MLEESLLKTNFIGRDGFRWWIGQICSAAEQANQLNGGGWGWRFKVRIMGYHPYSIVELPDKDLPWAICMLGVTDGTGAGNRATTVALSQGDVVLGFFLDGDNGQQPVIMGAFGNTLQKPSSDIPLPFTPFTGYTGRVKNDGSVVAKNEVNDSSAASQKSPRAVSKEDAKKVGQASGANDNPATKEIQASTAIGKKVLAATAATDSAIQNIQAETENFVKSVNDITGGINDVVGKKKEELFGLIDRVTASMQHSAGGMVQNMVTNTMDAMGTQLNTGLLTLYNGVFATVLAATGSSSIAKAAGTIAQASFIPSVKALSDKVGCMANSILNGIGDTIKGILQSVADNVTNFVSCIGDQVVGQVINVITGGISKFLGPLIGGLDKILNGFSPLTFLKKTADAMLGFSKTLGCEEVAPEFSLSSNEWIIGKGTTEKAGVAISDILKTANAVQSTLDNAVNAVQDIAGLSDSALGLFDFQNPSVSTPGFKSPLGECYAGPPELGGCGGTKIKLFGGKGFGGSASAIFGNLAAIADGGRGLTGSVIGVDLVNGGGGYTFPPFVEIVDECGRGIGATARAEVDYDPDSPTYQEITDIRIITPGFGYTLSSDNDDEYVFDDVRGPQIVSGGEDYDPETTTVTDSQGNTYVVQTDDDGGIIKVIRSSGATTSSNNVVGELDYPTVDTLVEYTVKSPTGSGAVLKPRLKKRPVEPQGEIKQVIDCISKEDDVVGYVDGKPYTGPFHVHPSNGRKMVGAFHVSSPHKYIYDTPEESLGSPTPIVGTTQSSTQTTTSTTTTTTSTSTPTATPSPTPTPTPTPPATSGGGGSAPTPSPTPTPPPSPPTPPPSSGGGGYGGGY